MDLYEELEQMALNAAEENSGETTETSQDSITRWQKLFDFSYHEAVSTLEKYRSDISRTRVSDEHWDIVRKHREGEGYDREAYEYSLTHKTTILDTTPVENGNIGTGRYTIRLEDPLSPDIIVQASGADQLSEAMSGTNDAGEKSQFHVISAATRINLLNLLATTHPHFKPLLVKLPEPAAKDLSPTSMQPMLGLPDTTIDTTLPQHRPRCKFHSCRPRQNEYPVWYFFYGTLGEPEVLVRLLGLTGEPVLYKALVRSGKLRTWGGKYRALVDAEKDAIVDGVAFEVMLKAQEDALRDYETNKYEVVRCKIRFKGRVVPEVKGLTFRFVGVVDEV